MSFSNVASDDKGSASSQDSERCGEASLTSTLEEDANQPLDASSILADKTVTDVLIVDWDGPDDPQNPRNWSFKRKWAATAIVSGFTFITPVSSSMIAPATNQLAVDFGIHSSVVIALSTSMFVLAFAVGPLFLGPVSEIYGRSRVLQLANLWYLAWNLGCGFARNENQLLAFRFLAGLGGSAPFAIGGAVLSDCWRPEERGRAVALYSLAPLLGPVIGPILGAWIAEYSTWRWVFWSTSFVDAIIQLAGLFFLQETYPPLLLERKANQIRQSMDEEKVPSKEVRTVFEGNDRSWQFVMSRALLRPFALVYHEPIMQLLCLYMAYVYGMLYVFLTTIPSMFEEVYQQPVGVAGLHYIALGVGLVGASQMNARTLDKIYVHFANKNCGVGKPEFRLPSMFPATIILPIGCLITGWTVQAHTHWIAPDIGIALTGAGIIVSYQCIMTYVLDAFTLHAASASAALSCLRSLAGFVFPLYTPAMYSALGFGKGDTILSLVAIVLGCPAPWIMWRYGERLRNASRHAR
ncbi:hypothetical protein PAXRUDRAFT_824246 [Paxillus rubicundulus Ve08.2h10]|uniref:Major facilitator superfamily (MFS) profile domain-containing protein n=1 Tax=Paxillus rubicundulus Ve08.2h10 TaxID=930991 RepID=A0A0D0DIG0_9AGAM|nr:hypothetical protein PAXRUDRAFT_824246 [Paxillus rubicundulus Ve08.2h10]